MSDTTQTSLQAVQTLQRRRDLAAFIQGVSGTEVQKLQSYLTGLQKQARSAKNSATSFGLSAMAVSAIPHLQRAQIQRAYAQQLEKQLSRELPRAQSAYAKSLQNALKKQTSESQRIAAAYIAKANPYQRDVLRKAALLGSSATGPLALRALQVMKTDLESLKKKAEEAAKNAKNSKNASKKSKKK